MNIFVFDIETIPDVEAGRKLLDLNGLSDEAVAEAMFAKAREDSGRDFVRHHLQKVVAISAVFRHKGTLKVWSLGTEQSTEAELIERFFSGIDKFMPNLVSWNGSGFDLPVLHYRALLQGIPSSTYWETGDFDSHFKWNNYLSRFHTRHLDLMDVLAGYQNRAFASLQDIAVMLGLPGKMGMAGEKVWEAYCKGQHKSIRDYCETDVLNTYLIYLRFELIRTKLTPQEYAAECDLVESMLEDSGQPHLIEFLNAWRQKPGDNL
jgi:predicted PolB exonuclease-like 3'-5' exonuclease